MFVEEPLFEPVASPRLKVVPRSSGVQVVQPILPDEMEGADPADLQRELLDGLLDRDGRVPHVIWYYTPMALAFSDHLAADVVVYDNMDELSLFRGASPELLAREGELFARADLVFTGGMSLFEAKRHRHRDVRCFPSSIDVRHFAAARRPGGEEPKDQASIPGPRVGFFGVIDERMDVELVERLADLRPDWHLVMIGPVVKIEPGILPRRPNIHWLGPKPYAQLPAHLAGWDIGFMPFALNEATRFISPTKTPEFLAAGLPVVSTRIKDVVRPYGEKGLVAIADTAAEMAEMAEALMRRPRDAWLAAVDRHLAASSWDSTWRGMRQAIAEASARRVASSRPALAAAAAG